MIPNILLYSVKVVSCLYQVMRWCPHWGSTVPSALSIKLKIDTSKVWAAPYQAIYSIYGMHYLAVSCFSSTCDKMLGFKAWSGRVFVIHNQQDRVTESCSVLQVSTYKCVTTTITEVQVNREHCSIQQCHPVKSIACTAQCIPLLPGHYGSQPESVDQALFSPSLQAPCGS